MKAKIYKPSKTSMQSGLGRTKKWILEFQKENNKFKESFKSLLFRVKYSGISKPKEKNLRLLPENTTTDESPELM